LQVKLTVVGAGMLAAAAAVTTVTVASAGEVSRGHDDAGSVKAGADHAVFVQGNELDGNTIHVFKRAQDGGLSSAGSYATGGKSRVSGSRPRAWNRCVTLTVPSGWTTRRCRCSVVHPGRSRSLPAVVNWS
jgi:hypothetical protein